MKIAVLKAMEAGESRVAATPDTIKKFVAAGADIAVEADAGAGESMESAFMLIDEALDMSSFRMEAASQFLPEVRVAMALLLGMPESPDYSGPDNGSHVSPRTTLATVEGCLAHCLLRARVELLAACSELFACNYAKC